MQTNHLTAKAQQILEGARDAFLEFGYEGASTDEIVRRAQVSKGTLYSYFPDKAAIFAAFVQNECREQAKQIFSIDPHKKPVAETLNDIGVAYLRFLTSTDAIRMFRVVVAAAERFPSLGETFYESGPKIGTARLAAYLQVMVEKGDLRIADTARAAHDFTNLCRSDLFYQRLLGIKAKASSTEIRNHVQHAVQLFLTAYASGSAAS